jgi:glycopeptide antibiotics resistance protein
VETQTALASPEASTWHRDDRTALALLFAVYLFVLIWLAVFKLHVPFIGRDDMREIKLIPFVAINGFGLNSPLELMGNVAVFIPFGIYLRTLVSWRPWAMVLTIAGTSVAVEVVQYVLAVGASDVSDLILNTAGGLAGIAIAARLRRRFGSRASKVVTDAATIATLIMLIWAGIHLASLPQMPSDGTILIQ